MKKHVLFLTTTAFTMMFGASVMAASQTDGEYMDWSYVRDMNAEPAQNTAAPTTTPQKIANAVQSKSETKNDQVYVTEGIYPCAENGRQSGAGFGYRL